MVQVFRGTWSEVVSDDTELLILVDSSDRETGQLDKSACHDGEGQLHRAFSVFIFNDAGELLIQQRAADKRLWPSFWSNSCCSHPRAGEAIDDAAERRCQQELGIAASLTFLYKFEYQAAYEDIGSERELCSVTSASTRASPRSTRARFRRGAGSPRMRSPPSSRLRPSVSRPGSSSSGSS